MCRKIELEYKFLLSKNDFERVHNLVRMAFEFMTQKVQINYYYDTRENDFNRRNETVRIRQQGEKLVLQRKRHHNKAELLNISDEEKVLINELPRKLYFADTDKSLLFKGEMVTQRTNYHFKDSGIISFDFNMFLGTCDYEIEIEIEDSEINEAQKIVDEFGLNLYCSESKSRRFFRRLEEMGFGKD